MSVKIRLTRMGGKKKPFYRIVVTDSNSPRDGKFLEIVGTYDPTKNPAKAELKENAIRGWLKKGAIPSETVGKVLNRAGILSKIAQAV
ncbi:MAG: 30S ribosomal protein S16 [Deltaproteobacteria bacterium RIFCSPLOWO2_12_FULL_43_16]|nr:MAG: 30S ribosomal protein S16 [Deltaproteobacteria bacterium GWA2_43_19]OGQ11816.1 MAG: 30S ribosomal protein S16 [Deltaproteobacteria bacterium RIFCSPHIGHO2_02_FULL_43_33]OGQ37378.1 MAG: 30S ribosomal protein S16 [Deltaproteobacteria bacterium RIFCSPLOWO2_01_FULL_42_9]OGQ60998.1 MAG: 30S ribosomal protein S16 [Deltaproteobacteria bacterium RIFCSPLOWO2_12_FULL_43_16]HBR17417.1 30S ribosomal protein S16 [Deltaproteobacteria bacterium]